MAGGGGDTISRIQQQKLALMIQAVRAVKAQQKQEEKDAFDKTVQLQTQTDTWIKSKEEGE